MNLYKDVVVKTEEPANPEHTVDRVQSISAAVFHLEQVKNTVLTFIYTPRTNKWAYMILIILDEMWPIASLLYLIDCSTLCVRLVFVPQVEQPLRNKKCVWHKLLSKQRKRAVVACFRMAPLYNLPRWISFAPVAHVELIYSVSN